MSVMSRLPIRTQQLIAMATGEPVRPSVLVPAPDEIERAKKAAAVAEAG